MSKRSAAVVRSNSCLATPVPTTKPYTGPRGHTMLHTSHAHLNVPAPGSNHHHPMPETIHTRPQNDDQQPKFSRMRGPDTKSNADTTP